MKVLIAILLMALLGFAITLYAWWWSFAITSFFTVVFLQLSPGKAFLAGFLSIALLWLFQAMALDAGNAHLLSHKVALLLPLHGSVAALLITTAIVGGLVSGAAALAGSYVRKNTAQA